MNNYVSETDRWLKSIHINGSVVDIGGGRRTAKERLGSCRGEYTILDRKNYKDWEYNPDIEHDMNYPLNQNYGFDCAFALMIVEFFWNPVEGFKNMSKLLKSGGKLYFNAPYKMPNLPDAENYYRFTDQAIKRLLGVTSFELNNLDFHSGEYEFYLVEATKV